MKNFNQPFCEQLLVSVKKKKKKEKRSRSNDLGSDEYSYSIFYSDPRISEYSDTRSSPTIHSYMYGSCFCISSNVLNEVPEDSLNSLKLQGGHAYIAKLTVFRFKGT